MKPQYSELLKRRVAELLHEMPRGSLKRIAKALDVTDRTLRHWKRSYPLIKKRGRRPKAVTLAEKIAIGREWKRQGYPGSRPIIQATTLRARAVREVLAGLKLKRKKRADVHRKKVQVRIKVKKPLAFAVMDGATLSKGDDHIVYRDRASLSVEAKACDGDLNATHTLTLLDELKAKGCLPFVLGTDNGSPFCAKIAQNYLQKNQVIHLRSMPRVPQQNGSAENAVYEFKRLAKLGLASVASQMLNDSRRRQSLGWQTANEYNRNTIPIQQETRSMFYETVLQNVKQAVHGTKSVYAFRKAEREAILQTMEDFELITRTRGGLPLRAKAEVIT